MCLLWSANRVGHPDPMRLKKEVKDVSTERFVTADEVAEFLGLSVSAIRKASTRQGSPLPCHRMPDGRATRYLISEVSDWMRTEGRTA